MQDTVLNFANEVGLAWWVEIKTQSPAYTYYFGPFILAANAHTAKSGYVEDLEKEGAQGIQVVVKRCKPADLTVADEPVSDDLSDDLNKLDHRKDVGKLNSHLPTSSPATQGL
jgi:hypothetical protein